MNIPSSILVGDVEREVDLSTTIGDVITSWHVFATSSNFKFCVIYTSDDDFNQALLIFDTIQDCCVHQLSNYDLKDEFYKKSASFTGSETSFIFVNARSERAADDMTVDINYLNIFDISTCKIKHQVNCGEKKFSCLKICDDALAIISFVDGSFSLYQLKSGEIYAIFPPAMANVTVADWMCINDHRLIALLVSDNSDSASQSSSNSIASIWQWTVPQKRIHNPESNLCDGSLVLEQSVMPKHKPPTQMLYIEDHDLLLTLVEEGALLNIWEFDTGDCLHTLKVHLDVADRMCQGVDSFVVYTFSVAQCVIKQWDLCHIVTRGKMTDCTLPVISDYSGEDVTSQVEPRSQTTAMSTTRRGSVKVCDQRSSLYVLSRIPMLNIEAL